MKKDEPQNEIRPVWRDSILFQTLRELNQTEYDILCAYEEAGNPLTEEDKIAKSLFERYYRKYYQKKTAEEAMQSYIEKIKKGLD